MIPTAATLQKIVEFLKVALTKLFEEDDEKKSTISNHINHEAVLGSIGENATNIFFDNKETEEKFQNMLAEAFVSAMETTIAKFAKERFKINL